MTICKHCQFSTKFIGFQFLKNDVGESDESCLCTPFIEHTRACAFQLALDSFICAMGQGEASEKPCLSIRTWQHLKFKDLLWSTSFNDGKSGLFIKINIY